MLLLLSHERVGRAPGMPRIPPCQWDYTNTCVQPPETGPRFPWAKSSPVQPLHPLKERTASGHPRDSPHYSEWMHRCYVQVCESPGFGRGRADVQHNAGWPWRPGPGPPGSQLVQPPWRTSVFWGDRGGGSQAQRWTVRCLTAQGGEQRWPPLGGLYWVLLPGRPQHHSTHRKCMSQASKPSTEATPRSPALAMLSGPQAIPCLPVPPASRLTCVGQSFLLLGFIRVAASCKPRLSGGPQGWAGVTQCSHQRGS